MGYNLDPDLKVTLTVHLQKAVVNYVTLRVLKGVYSASKLALPALYRVLVRGIELNM